METIRIFQVSLGYISQWSDSDKENLPVKVAERRALLEKLDVKHNYDDDAISRGPTVCLNGDQVLNLVREKQDFEIVNEIGVSVDGLASAAMRLEAVINKATEAMSKLPTNSLNEKVNVHVPGAALMFINRTMLLEDGCSDALQNYLNDGWRIVAACPQPDSRRPDYILGRYDPEYKPGNADGALRG
jgi:hypothetical protein